MILLLGVILLAAPGDDFKSELDFGNLTNEEIKQVADKDVDVICKVLIREILREADKRKIEPEVRTYLEMSFYCWEKECKSNTELWKNGLGLDEDSGGTRSRRGRGERGYNPYESRSADDIVKGAAAERLQTLINERYFASFSEAKFGQMITVGKVFQVIDNQSYLAEVANLGDDNTQLILISQVDTSQIADGDALPLSYFVERLWELDGTYRYVTLIGATKTVRKVKPFPLNMKIVLEEIDLFMFGKHLRAMEANCRNQHRDVVMKSRQNSEYNRVWKDKTGQFSITATFSGLIGDQVKLLKENGEEIKVPLSKLSDEDKQWINELK
ncbi:MULTISPECIES: SHD1 domain-containing protein [Pirellulaceae]|nr:MULTISPECIES: SHD1 domain-containing protein [Pirellulaceae]